MFPRAPVSGQEKKVRILQAAIGAVTVALGVALVVEVGFFEGFLNV